MNHLARRGVLEPGAQLFGAAFENWVFHELCAHIAYSESDARLSYWRVASGIEVDFIIDDMRTAIEAKSTAKATADHLKGLRSLVQDHPRVQQRILVCREPEIRKTDDGILILPFANFSSRLTGGEPF